MRNRAESPTDAATALTNEGDFKIFFCRPNFRDTLILTFSQREKELPLLCVRVQVSADRVFAAISTIKRSRSRWTCFTSPRHRHGKDSPFVHFHFHFLETGRAHEFVHLRRGAPPHDPGLALAVAQNTRDEFH